MTEHKALLSDLVVASRILANEGICDAFGHISVRHPENPERFFLARAVAPELVTIEDIVEFNLDGTAVCDDRKPFLERVGQRSEQWWCCFWRWNAFDGRTKHTYTHRKRECG